MRALLDVNVLVALLDRQHQSHIWAHRWLSQNRSHGWASCPLTENGCLRILSNPRYPAPVSMKDVLDKLSHAKATGYHEFWPDNLSITDRSCFDLPALQGHQQLTDVYLLGLAIHRSGRLVTFDKRIALSPVCGAESRHLSVIEDEAGRSEGT